MAQVQEGGLPGLHCAGSVLGLQHLQDAGEVTQTVQLTARTL